MKKALLLIATILVSLITNSQQELTKVNQIEGNVEIVSSIKGNTNFSFIQDNEFKVYNTQQGGVNVSYNNIPNYNGISGTLLLTGDTIQKAGDYYLMSNGSVLTGNNNMILNNGISKLLYDYNTQTLYAYHKPITVSHNGRFYKYKNGLLIDQIILGTTLKSKVIECTYLFLTNDGNGNNNVVFINPNENIPGGQNYFSIPIDYTTANHTILFQSECNRATIPELTNYEHIDDSYLNGLSFAVGNNIYNINTPLTYSGQNINPTLDYTVPSDMVINNLSINNLPSNFSIYVSTDNGIYTNNLTLGVKEESMLENISLYPNPNHGNFTIENIESNTTINIISSTGQIIYNTTTNNTDHINLDMDIPNGIYFIQLINNDSQKTIKFIKE